MENNCELIKDLLPLYTDGLCSKYTKSIVRDHIDKCQDCGKLTKSLFSQNTTFTCEREAKKAANPFLKVKRKYHSIIAISVAVAVGFFVVLFWLLFLMGSTASTSSITVQSVQMFDDNMTFSLELSSNLNFYAIRRVYFAPRDSMGEAISEHGTGDVYIKVDTVIVLPFYESVVYKTTCGLGVNDLNSEGITAIYLIGKDPKDFVRIWEK